MSQKFKNISKDFEIEIRRWYSSKLESIERLQVWVESTFAEWKRCDDEIYQYDVRIKSIDSLLAKVSYLKSKRQLDSIQDIEDNINDVLGARLLVYSPSQIKNAHNLLMSNKRMLIEQVLIHHHVNPEIINLEIKKIETKIKQEMPKDSYSVEENITGYTGLHYVIQPTFMDDFYSKVDVFPKFELQIRTLIQHAWSEIQHKLVYKNSRIDYLSKELLGGKFEMLAEIINHNDSLLDRLSVDSRLVKSSPIENKDNDFINGLANTIVEYEKNNVASEQKYKKLDKYFSYKKNIKLRDEIFATGSYEEKLQICEFYLKSSHFKEAKELYETYCISNSHRESEPKYTWALLRYAECCEVLAEEQSATETVLSLFEILIDLDAVNLNELELYGGCCVLLWKTGNALRAYQLNEVILAQENLPYERMVNYKLNGIYYFVDLARVESIGDSEMIDYNKLKQNLLEMVETADEISSVLMTKNNTKLMRDHIPNYLDTISWFYYNLSEASAKSGDFVLAEESIRQAEKLSIECNELYSKRHGERTEKPIIWSTHKSMISRLKRSMGVY